MHRRSSHRVCIFVFGLVITLCTVVLLSNDLQDSIPARVASFSFKPPSFTVITTGNVKSQCIDSIYTSARSSGVKIIIELANTTNDLNRAVFRNGNRDYVAILPHDCIILKDWFNNMLHLFNDVNVAVVGSKVLDANGRVIHCGVDFASGRLESRTNTPLPFLRLRGVHKSDTRANKQHHGHVSLVGSAFRTDVFKKSRGLVDYSCSPFSDLVSPEQVDFMQKMKKWTVYAPSCVVLRTVTRVDEMGIMSTDGCSTKSWQMLFTAWHGKLMTEINAPTLYMSAPFSSPSGFANEALSFATALDGIVNLKIRDGHGSLETAGLEVYMKEQMIRLRDRYIDMRGAIYLELWTPEHFNQPFGTVAGIGQHMFETDRLPSTWPPLFDGMDEMWVPSEFNIQTFKGVKNVHKLHQCVDTNHFDPVLYERQHDGVYKFLAVFEWTDRKDWKTLLEAFFREFGKTEAVLLYIKSHLQHNHMNDNTESIRALIAGVNGADMSMIKILGKPMEQRQIPQLYKSVDCYVMPSHGEGWGRPYMEAMSMGLPVIATGWSGNMEYMTKDNSILLDYDLVTITSQASVHEQYVGHQWAKARLDSLRRAMRDRLKRQDDKIKAKARFDIVEKWSQRMACNRFIARLKAINL